MKKRDLIEAIPLIILTIIAVNSIIQVLTTDYVFGVKQHIGLTLLAISIMLFFVNRRIYKYIFGISLLLGLLTLISFSTTIISMSFFGLVIQILLIPLIGIYIWIYKDAMQPKVQQLVGSSEESVNSEMNAKINGFKRRFEKLSDSEIESKLNEGLVSEAMEALKQIKAQREKVQ